MKENYIKEKYQIFKWLANGIIFLNAALFIMRETFFENLTDILLGLNMTICRNIVQITYFQQILDKDVF